MDLPNIDVDIIINNTYPIKSHIDERFILGKRLNVQGAHGEIRTACFQNDCRYIAKIFKINNKNNNPNCYTYKDLVRNEMIITKHMSEFKIGPQIYDLSLSDTEGIMIMNKYDGTLSDLLYLYQTDKSIPMEQIIQLIKEMVERMHSQGIIHRDLSSDNILYTQSGLISIIDYGLAFYSTSELLKKGDIEFIEGIQNVYELIDKGENFPDPEEIMLAALPNNNAIIRFLWNGNECDDWQ